jgi:hypothetical protein
VLLSKGVVTVELARSKLAQAKMRKKKIQLLEQKERQQSRQKRQRKRQIERQKKKKRKQTERQKKRKKR